MERRSKVSEWFRRRRRTDGGEDAAHRDQLLLDAVAAAFPVAPAAHPFEYGCSCDRIGCPSPGMHPVSFAWQTQATTDPEQVRRWLRAQPQANFVTATGRSHDVLDVPMGAGAIALRMLEERGLPVGPVAACGPDRCLFFTATRGTPADEDEWWPCELDCHPETLEDHPGLRWHCRGSYVLLPPSRHPAGGRVTWISGPQEPLPDPLPLLEVLADACAAVAAADSPSERLLGR
ncbi:DNA primase [Wenjunlia vitaminophila]|uniref:DNA primase n=1 Tax=Wenjunlia vitaminophila TaxID=76728 RepID=A0A0T6LLB2_WENVI|nr:bifunctional DNA primase/polymerase [Wenjunlia vitaminophila]KRV46689.1 DNA primase [Wenjunlia vitaminophila]